MDNIIGRGIRGTNFSFQHLIHGTVEFSANLQFSRSDPCSFSNSRVNGKSELWKILIPLCMIIVHIRSDHTLQGTIHSFSQVSLWVIGCGEFGSYSPLVAEFTEHLRHKLTECNQEHPGG